MLTVNMRGNAAFILVSSAYNQEKEGIGQSLLKVLLHGRSRATDNSSTNANAAYIRRSAIPAKGASLVNSDSKG